MELSKAPDISRQIRGLIRHLSLTHLRPRQIFCMRSFGSSARARARIWGYPKIWQLAIGSGPAYVIEVLSEKFDRLSSEEKTKTLIHELLHIPKNFSGALLPHRNRGRFTIEAKTQSLYDHYFARR